MRFFWVFSWKIKLQHLMSSVAVRFVYPLHAFLDKFGIDQLLWLRDTIVGGRAVFEWKFMLLYLLSTVKAKPVDKMKQSTYLCVILHVKHKKLPILSVLTWFLILGKIQDGGQGGYHVWWRHRSEAATLPIKYSLSCWEDQSLFDERKAFSKYWWTLTYQKLKGGVPLIKPPPPPPPLYHGGGMTLCVRPRVKR